MDLVVHNPAASPTASTAIASSLAPPGEFAVGVGTLPLARPERSASNTRASKDERDLVAILRIDANLDLSSRLRPRNGDLRNDRGGLRLVDAELRV
jgi:hypothetical protein